MYGLINKAIKQYIEGNYGEQVWKAILSRAHVHDDEFASFEYFPDEVTYEIVTLLCEETGKEIEVILEDIGKFWMKFTGVDEYEEILKFAGNDFKTFVLRLNKMHKMVKKNFLELQPPQFFVTDEKKDSFILHYHSDRPALLPMVIGILKELGKNLIRRLVLTLLRQGKMATIMTYYQLAIKQSSQNNKLYRLI